MNCPDEVAEIVLDILKIAILRIRAADGEGNPDRCAIEADHIHNLPALLVNFSADALKYYLEVERPCYVERIGADDIQFAHQWERLAGLLQPAAI